MTMFSCDSSPYDTPHPSQLSMHEQADDIHELVEHLQAARLFPDIPVIEARDQVTGSPASAWESTDGGESSKLQSGASNVEGDASQLVVSQYYKDTIDQAVERTMEKMRIVQSYDSDDLVSSEDEDEDEDMANNGELYDANGESHFANNGGSDHEGTMNGYSNLTSVGTEVGVVHNSANDKRASVQVVPTFNAGQLLQYPVENWEDAVQDVTNLQTAVAHANDPNAWGEQRHRLCVHPQGNFCLILKSLTYGSGVCYCTVDCEYVMPMLETVVFDSDGKPSLDELKRDDTEEIMVQVTTVDHPSGTFVLRPSPDLMKGSGGECLEEIIQGRTTTTRVQRGLHYAACPNKEGSDNSACELGGGRLREDGPIVRNWWILKWKGILFWPAGAEDAVLEQLNAHFLDESRSEQMEDASAGWSMPSMLLD